MPKIMMKGKNYSSATGGEADSAKKLSTARNINGVRIDGTADRFNYAMCLTAAGATAKTVVCVGFSLATGSEITVKFVHGNTATDPALNVNNTGAKKIHYHGSAISPGLLAENGTYTFRYNGTQYDLVGNINTDASTINGHRVTTIGERGCIPLINPDGVMEIGRYLDFHVEGTANDKDNDARITADPTGLTLGGVTKGSFEGNLEGNATRASTADWADAANSANNANAANTAGVAAKLGNSGDANQPMVFHWSGQNGQPAWLWGGVDGANMYVYNPENLRVDYANSANYANSAGAANSVAYENVSGRPTFALEGSTLYINL